MSLGAVLGFAAPIVGSLVSGLFGNERQESANEATRDTNTINAQVAQAINDQNIAFQERTAIDNRNWQRDIMDRAHTYAESIANRNFHEALGFSNLDYARAKEFAQSGIQWRTQDAIAAGMHPVYALGGSGSTYSPSQHVGSMEMGHGTATDQVAPRAEAYRAQAPGPSSGDWSSMGQGLEKALTAFLNPYERQLQELTLRKLAGEVSKDEALTSYYNARAAGVVQSAGQTAPFPTTEAITAPYQAIEMPKGVQLGEPDANYPGKYDVVEPKGVPVYSGRRDNTFVGAGPASPAWQEVGITKYMNALMPISEEGWAESIGEMPMWMWPAWLQANTDYYGKDFWRVAVQELSGRSALGRWLSRLRFTEEGSMRGPVYGPVRR